MADGCAGGTQRVRSPCDIASSRFVPATRKRSIAAAMAGMNAISTKQRIHCEKAVYCQKVSSVLPALRDACN